MEVPLMQEMRGRENVAYVYAEGDP